jgi:hypothetical protein
MISVSHEFYGSFFLKQENGVIETHNAQTT